MIDEEDEDFENEYSESNDSEMEDELDGSSSDKSNKRYHYDEDDSEDYGRPSKRRNWVGVCIIFYFDLFSSSHFFTWNTLFYA